MFMQYAISYTKGWTDNEIYGGRFSPKHQPANLLSRRDGGVHVGRERRETIHGLHHPSEGRRQPPGPGKAPHTVYKG